MRKLNLKENLIPALVILVAFALFCWVAVSLLFSTFAYANSQPAPKDPMSYQRYECPFSEQVGPKGCIPPPDITCTDSSYTQCEYVGNKVAEPVPAPSAPPAASHEVKPLPVIVNCSEV